MNRIWKRELYENPSFKSEFWKNSEVYSEQTPLTVDNIQKVLNQTNYSNAYETFAKYESDCQTKNYPQVVGLENIDHWIAVRKVGDIYYFTDATGAPKEVYYRINEITNGEVPEIPDLPASHDVVSTESGQMRQSPLANSCGLFALFYCLGWELERNPYGFWDDHAHKVWPFVPPTISNWHQCMKSPVVAYYLYPNDIHLYWLYKEQIGHD